MKHVEECYRATASLFWNARILGSKTSWKMFLPEYSTTHPFINIWISFAFLFSLRDWCTVHLTHKIKLYKTHIFLICKKTISIIHQPNDLHSCKLQYQIPSVQKCLMALSSLTSNQICCLLWQRSIMGLLLSQILMSKCTWLKWSCIISNVSQANAFNRSWMLSETH